ncbi:MAG TPA: RNA-protein complex protein Nop10 [Thermoplasmata archaeon]|jgi:H/ACA ribonucleoprotein complex subunit 3|nr:RNA-protein complex protein Nop10 [Thermoplasmata archaeon]
MTESVLRVCPGCGRYTFRATCPACTAATRTPHPARFDPGDRYGKYRRALLAAAQAERR